MVQNRKENHYVKIYKNSVAGLNIHRYLAGYKKDFITLLKRSESLSFGNAC